MKIQGFAAHFKRYFDTEKTFNILPLNAYF